MATYEDFVVVVLALLIGWFAEKHYVSRVGILPNLLPVAYALVVNWSTLFVIGQGWLVFGVLLGILGLLSYHQEWSLPEEIHELAYALYSLKTITGIYIGLLVFGDPTLAFISGVFIALPIWGIGVKYFENDVPFSDY